MVPVAICNYAVHHLSQGLWWTGRVHTLYSVLSLSLSTVRVAGCRNHPTKGKPRYQFLAWNCTGAAPSTTDIAPYLGKLSTRIESGVKSLWGFGTHHWIDPSRRRIIKKLLSLSLLPHLLCQTQLLP